MKPGHLGVRRLGVLTSVSATAAPSERALEGGPLVIPGKGRTSWSPKASADNGWGSRLAHCLLGGMKTWAPSWALSQTLGGVGVRAPQPGEGVGGLAALCVWAKWAVGLPGWAAPPLVLQQEQLFLVLALCTGRSPRPRVLTSRSGTPPG